MKLLKLNKDSWHYKLAMMYDKWMPDNTDICTYTRTLIASFCLMTFAICVMGLLAGSLLFMFGGWIAYFLGYELHGAVIPFTFIYGVSAVIIGIVWAKAFYQERKWTQPEKEPGFIRTAYRSWKDKFCVKVEFK
jgi:hypothetical protein